jgi:nucleoside-triphosphatase THEP1
MGEITILTGPVSSGKTTLLTQFIAKNSGCAGFLCPDKEGLRYLVHITENSWYPFQIEPPHLNDYMQVGKFFFLTDTFALARNLLDTADTKQSHPFIIDEIGWLELEGKGLEPALSQFFKRLAMQESNLQVIAVIRQSLVAAITRQYCLDEAIVLDLQQFASIHQLDYFP